MNMIGMESVRSLRIALAAGIFFGAQTVCPLAEAAPATKLEPRAVAVLYGEADDPDSDLTRIILGIASNPDVHVYRIALGTELSGAQPPGSPRRASPVRLAAPPGGGGARAEVFA